MRQLTIFEFIKEEIAPHLMPKQSRKKANPYPLGTIFRSPEGFYVEVESFSYNENINDYCLTCKGSANAPKEFFGCMFYAGKAVEFGYIPII